MNRSKHFDFGPHRHHKAPSLEADRSPSRARLGSSPPPLRPHARARSGHRIPVILAVLVGCALFAVATGGGRNTRQTQPLVAELDRLAARVGLGLSEIRITGHSKTDDRLIFDALGLTEVYSLIGFDAQAARARIEQLPWVRSAVIQRSIPNGLDIVIAERVPVAIWDYAGRRMLIDDTARVLGPAPAAETALPVVGGAGADTAAAELLGVLGEHPRILGRMAIAQRIEGRRWTLVLEAGAVVHLPAEGEAEALWRLTMARSGGALADRGLAVIDLRAPAHVTIATGAASSVADLGGLARSPGAVPMGRPIAIRSQ